MTEVVYIWHDCFLVRSPRAALVFDFWQDPVSGKDRGGLPRFVEDLPPELPLYVFVSHGHKDHFNPEVFGWSRREGETRYIVSRDVWRRCRHVVSATSVYNGPRLSADQLVALAPGDLFEDEILRVGAFPSTDIGNSYMVEVKEGSGSALRLFHAGDLNAWVWRDESTPQEIRKATGDFLSCLAPIEAWLDAAAAEGGDAAIDCAFFPVDSRIGTGYWEGARIFMERLRVRRFFPMHFGLGSPDEQARRRRDALCTRLYSLPGRGEIVPLADPYAAFVLKGK